MPTIRRMPFQQAIIDVVFGRQRTGSLLCSSCGVLVGVNDATCYNCGRRNPGLWGLAPALRALGSDLGFVPFVIGACVVALRADADLLARRGRHGRADVVHGADLAARCFSSARAAPLPVFGLGRWWTVLSAGWLHGSAPAHPVQHDVGAAARAGHGRAVRPRPDGDHLHGRRRSAALRSVRSRARSCPDLLILRGGQFTVGASASIFGLLGALVYYGRRAGSSAVGSQATQLGRVA